MTTYWPGLAGQYILRGKREEEAIKRNFLSLFLKPFPFALSSNFLRKKKRKSGEFKMTHQATAKNVLINFTHGLRCSAYLVFLYSVIYFSNGWTDTKCENNDHLFGRGLVGQGSRRKKDFYLGRYCRKGLTFSTKKCLLKASPKDFFFFIYYFFYFFCSSLSYSVWSLRCSVRIGLAFELNRTKKCVSSIYAKKSVQHILPRRKEWLRML